MKNKIDNEIVIMISDRDAYYLANAVAWKRDQRKRFGVTGLGDKVYGQLSKLISAQRMSELNSQWSESKEKCEAGEKKEQVGDYCFKHRIKGKCLLCGTTMHTLKKIRTPQMDSFRRDALVEKRMKTK